MKADIQAISHLILQNVKTKTKQRPLSEYSGLEYSVGSKEERTEVGAEVSLFWAIFRFFGHPPP